MRASSPLEASSSTPTSSLPQRHSPDIHVRQLPRRGSHLDPDDSLGAPSEQPLFNNQLLADHFPGEDEANARVYQDQMAALQRMFGMGPSPFGGDEGSSQQQQQDPMSSFPFNPAMLAGMQPVQTTVDTSARYWTLAHFVTISLLGIYAVISEFNTVGASHFAHLIMKNEPDSPFGYGFVSG